MKIPLLGGLKQRLKKGLCDEKFEVGDIVRVESGPTGTAQILHPIGGLGHWATFVKKTPTGFMVRPLSQTNEPGPPVEAISITSLDGVLLREIKSQRRRERAAL